MTENCHSTIEEIERTGLRLGPILVQAALGSVVIVLSGCTLTLRISPMSGLSECRFPASYLVLCVLVACHNCICQPQAVVCGNCNILTLPHPASVASAVPDGRTSHAPALLRSA